MSGREFRRGQCLTPEISSQSSTARSMYRRHLLFGAFRCGVTSARRLNGETLFLHPVRGRRHGIFPLVNTLSYEYEPFMHTDTVVARDRVRGRICIAWMISNFDILLTVGDVDTADLLASCRGTQKKIYWDQTSFDLKMKFFFVIKETFTWVNKIIVRFKSWHFTFSKRKVLKQKSVRVKILYIWHQNSISRRGLDIARWKKIHPDGNRQNFNRITRNLFILMKLQSVFYRRIKVNI